MPTINEIEQYTKDFADAREKLSTSARQLEDVIEKIKRRRLPIIKMHIKNVLAKQDILKAALEASQALFEKPKTKILHGIKVGFKKAKGKLEWADDDVVVKLIKRHFPEQVDILVKTTEKPIKDALANLPAADLKKLGITVHDTGDAVVIKSTDSEIDKFVESLLKEDETKEAEAA